MLKRAVRVPDPLDYLECQILAQDFQGELRPHDPADATVAVALAQLGEASNGRGHRRRRGRVLA
jgi:hypothetical protein